MYVNIKNCKTAVHVHINAQYNLGCLYSTAQGVEKDNKEVINWYLKAAELVDVTAQIYSK
jgi:TPR repeat protein